MVHESHNEVQQPYHQRKNDLIDLGVWALTTGRGWLVHAIHRAILQEVLRHA